MHFASSGQPLPPPDHDNTKQTDQERPLFSAHVSSLSSPRGRYIFDLQNDCLRSEIPFTLPASGNAQGSGSTASSSAARPFPDRGAPAPFATAAGVVERLPQPSSTSAGTL